MLMSLILGLFGYVIQIGILLALIDCVFYLKKIYNEMTKKDE